MFTAIYHITSAANIPSIMAAKGLWSDSDRLRLGLDCVGIGHSHIKERRMRRAVKNRDGHPVAAGGFVGEYVPFYLGNRSPMLLTISSGNVMGYAGGQSEIVYLVSSVEQVESGNRPWCFTDGNAVEAITEFLTGPELLSTMDWPVIHAREWFNTPNDPDRKRRKQAECLVHQFFPWSWIAGIAVLDPPRAAQVAKLIAGAEHQPRVVIRDRWYYD